jgi:glycosyltransferase involved in cell wall biosynthesis
MSAKNVYLDTTYLHYGADLRGVPQVIFQLVRLILGTGAFSSFRFIATKKVASAFLLPQGVPENRIAVVSAPPFPFSGIRFHGLFCNRRYRGIAQKASLIIHPEYRTAQSSSVKQVVVFHDFLFLDDFNAERSPGWPAAPLKRLYRNHIGRKLTAASAVRHLVTVSEYTKARLVSLFPALDPSSIAVLHNGVRFSGLLKHKADVPSRHVPLELLCVGGLDEYRKNFSALMRQLPRVTGGRPFCLHLVGKCPPWFRESMVSALPSPDLAASLVFHGIIDDQSLAGLYASSHFFLFPSLAEGFGLPLVEAMAHGLVACAFNNTSIPEVCDDAAVLAENNDFTCWGDAIARLSGDPAGYRELSEKAQARAKDFSEEKMFARYENYLRGIINSINGQGTSG